MGNLLFTLGDLRAPMKNKCEALRYKRAEKNRRGDIKLRTKPPRVLVADPARAAFDSPNGRMDRVRRLQALIAAGDYRVSSEDVALKLLSFMRTG